MNDRERQDQIDAFKRNLEDAKEAHAIRRDFIGFTNQSAIELTSSATKAFLLINGGAAVAMLGFVASVADGSGAVKLEMPDIVDALMWFGWGVLVAAVCSGLAYCVMFLQGAVSSEVTFTWEFLYIEERQASKWLLRVTHLAHVAAVLAGILSLVFFSLGLLSVAEAIGNSNP
ncbi:hypothetical protein [Aliiroseovarius crassostreae]|uniref:hypothetical protein n=1 Tax=Aliiroseovarius crassostreae TaxID=154981 RepID=UPI003C79CEB1